MEVRIDGILLRKDLKEYITESFAERYNVNLENWIEPYAYWNEKTQTVLSNGVIPDGTYVLFGKVSYPGKERMSRHSIFQFNLVKLMGVDVTFAAPFREYPNVPPRIPLQPVFPLFKIDQPRSYKKAAKIFNEALNKPLTIFELERMIKESKENSLENKMYRLRYAVQLEIDKEK